jgi:hypothetical protein
MGMSPFLRIKPIGHSQFGAYLPGHVSNCAIAEEFYAAPLGVRLDSTPPRV